MYGYMHINEAVTVHLAAVENMHVREWGGGNTVKSCTFGLLY